MRRRLPFHKLEVYRTSVTLVRLCGRIVESVPEHLTVAGRPARRLCIVACKPPVAIARSTAAIDRPDALASLAGARDHARQVAMLLSHLREMNEGDRPLVLAASEIAERVVEQIEARIRSLRPE